MILKMEKSCIALILVMAVFQLTAALPFNELESSDRERVVPGPSKLICYFGSWSVYRPGNGKFDVDDIDPDLCTHLIFGFAALENNTMDKIIAYDPWNELCPDEPGGGKCAYQRFNALKEQNPDLKTLLAIGGWNEGSEKYSMMARDPVKRSKFVQSVVAFLRKYGFDGLDFDWEYPGARGGDPDVDKANFVEVLRELKIAFELDKFMLTSAVAIGKDTVDLAYDVPQLNIYLDHIHLMAYDFHGAWENDTGVNAPLYGNSEHDVEDEYQFNVEWGVDYWLSLGADPAKLIMGLPTYGRGFTLEDPSRNQINSPTIGPIAGGPYSRLNGSWGFNEICEAQRGGGWTIVQDTCFQVPYMYKDRQWIGYDDVPAVTRKAQFAAAKNLGGVLAWSIDQDDFMGWCTGTTFALTRAAKETMLAGATETPPKCDEPVRTSSATTARATTTKVATTSSPSGQFQCPENNGGNGFYAIPGTCGSEYYSCVSGSASIMTCPDGMIFDPETRKCTSAGNASC